MSAPPPDELRARAWSVLSGLYLEGVTEALLPLLRDLPDLADALPDRFDPDEAAAEHHRLFGLEVFPYASVFLERDGMLGGPVSDEVGRAFARAGLPAPRSREAPDHVGHELALLATLTQRGDDDAVAQHLGDHLLWWLPLFVHSARRHAPPFWRAVLELTLDAAFDQARSVLAVGREAADPPGALALPVEEPLDDPAAGLGRVARYLVTPARGGVFLAVSDVAALGRSLELPRGFGGRERTMTNLLRSAAGFGELGTVVDGLRGLADEQSRLLQRVPEPFRRPWSTRLAARARVLERLAAG